MSEHNPAFVSARLWALAERLNRWPVRASARALAGSLPTGALAGALSDLPDADPGSNDRLIDLGVAVAAAAVLVLLLRRFGQDQGILFGLKLTILSYLFWQALVAAAYAAWLAAGIDGPTDSGLIGFTAAFSAALFIPSGIMLRKLDPDF